MADGRHIRRTEWTEEELNKLRDLAGNGMLNKHIAACFGYSPQHFSELIRTRPEVSSALKEGRAKGLADVAAALTRDARLGCTTAQIFFLKCHGGWRDNAPSVDDDGTDGDTQSIGKRVLDGVRRLRKSGDGSGSSGATD